MSRHDLQLWAYASKELELGEHRWVQHHLEDCPECTEQLAAVQVAKEALELAREAPVLVPWSKVDERIGALVEKRLASKARRPLFVRGGFAGLGLFAAAAALVLWLTPPAAVVPEAPAAGVTAPVASWARVDRAEGLTRLGATPVEVADGAELAAGDVLRTSLQGRAFVHLPDESHVRVGAGSQVAMTRTEADDVALTLERGRVAVRASHQPRKGFVVHSGGVTVHVVGTVFGVSHDGELVEVAVTEGRVRVELPSGDSSFVEPGQRLRFDTRSEQAKRLKVSDAQARELAEVAVVADATASVERRTVVAAVGGTPSAPPLVHAQGAPRALPRLSAAEAKARQATPPSVGLSPEALAVLPAPAPAPAPTQVVIEAPVDVWPSVGGGEIVRGVPARREAAPREVTAPTPAPVEAERTASRPEEWAAPPVADETEWAPHPAKPAVAEAPPAPATRPEPGAAPSRLSDGPAVTAAPAGRVAAKDLEQLFLQRAADSLEKGACERYLLGLEDIAQDAQRNPRTEQARVLRARCFDAQLRPRQAMNEYRKYLEEYPAGRHTPEARAALGE